MPETRGQPMCQLCDQRRTVLLLIDLSAYADRPGADQEFADIVGLALSASLPAGQHSSTCSGETGC
ncbi:hypothetical protein G4Z16_20255 [Streptomyces bathyalis]|uniref:Uncharacterized protein n=1 Tax=Streptomyces bathyalis TaxID=2710756 RepID=A0A7T1T264_9ACTN|nr:hypothetical protein [Streptomyces bathyalis]QPP05027.1 hypothetical protein G4Z16_20255 [Streptomyces bathyalis]